MTDSAVPSRRNLLQSAALAAALLPLAPMAAKAAQPAAPSPRKLKLGVATYSLRKMPLEAAIAAIRRVGLAYASIKDFHLPLKSTPQQRKAVADQFKAAGITPLSCGVITMKNDEANIRAAFEYARDAGIPTIVCNPAPASMPLLDKFVKEFDIRLAIHNHGPESKTFPTPYEALKLIESLDPRVGICVDVGHTIRAGADPAEAILKCRARLFDVHIKDLLGTQPNAKESEVGRGALDIKGILQALVQIDYPHLVGFEYEKDPDDVLPGLAESVGYVKGVLTGLGA